MNKIMLQIRSYLRSKKLNVARGAVAISLFAVIFSQSLAYADELYSNQQKADIKESLAAAQKGDWQRAFQFAAKTKDSLVTKAIYWMKIKKDPTGENFATLSKFYNYASNWPEARLIQIRVEESMDISMPTDQILGWFSKHPAESSSGIKLYLEAMYNKYGYDPKVISLAKSSWKECNFSEKEERIFLSRFGKYITDSDNFEKIDRLFWIRRIDEANRNLFRLSKDKQLLFKTRLAFIENKQNAITLLGNLSQKNLSDPGLLYERLIWNEKKENTNTLNILMHHIPDNPPFYSKWWEFKSRQIRSLIENKQYEIAYKLTSMQKNTNPSKYAEAEWLAGWISLRYLNKPEQATIHFNNMNKVVKLPISISRTGYWIGRSLEKQGKKEEAEHWYRKASFYPSTFYGQLALLKVSNSGKFDLSAFPEIAEEDHQHYRQNNYAKLALIFSLQNNNISKQFIAKAIEHAQSKGEMVLVANLGVKLKKHDLALEAAKNASYKMVSIPNICYPTIELDNCGIVEEAFVHALIRQESMFNPFAESSAGALGLMQIMPATGKNLASSLKTKFDTHKLKHDYKFNIKLGVHYLNKIMQNFGGSYILTAASYNAGEQNVKKWIARFGDPRAMNSVEDVVDWIELITFNETRNYVQRVLESVQVYRTIIDKSGKYKTDLHKDLRLGNAAMLAS